MASKLFGVRNSLQVHGELKLGKLSGGPRASERLFLGTGYKSSPAAVSNLWTWTAFKSTALIRLLLSRDVQLGLH